MASEAAAPMGNARALPAAVRTACVLLLLALLVAQVVAAIRTTSATDDEPYCIVSGLTALRTGDYRFNTDHPPLMSMLLGAAAHLAGAAPLPRNSDWDRGLRMRYSYFYLWHGPNAARALVLIEAARLPVLALSFALALLVFFWARRLYGATAALLSLALYCTEPNLLAHSSVAALDLGLAAAFCLTIYAWWRYLDTGSPFALLLTGISFGAAAAIKLPGLLLLLVLPLLFAVGRKQGSRLTVASLGRPLAAVLGLALLTLWAVYRFSSAPVSASPGALSLPLGSYLQSISFQLNHQQSGHPAYLFGMVSDTGWWFYYPVAFLVKTSLPLLLLLGLALSKGYWSRDELFLALPAALFLAVAMLQGLDLGIRYLLPIYPLLIILVGRTLTREWPASWRRWPKAAVVVLALWAAAEAARYAPHYLSYFNGLAGGPRGGGRVLVDSNLDWGQDLPSLAAWQRAHPEAAPLSFAYFGPADVSRYGVRCQRLPDLGPSDPPHPPEWYQTESGPRTGWIAISENCLALLPNYAWLKSYQPVARPAPSLRVYRITALPDSAGSR